MRVELTDVVRQGDEQVHAALDREAVVMSIAAGRYYTLGDVGSRIWELLERPIRVEEIRDRLLAEFDVERGRCEREVLDFLRELAADRLVEVEDGANAGGAA
jgi:hypothetical protein